MNLARKYEIALRTLATHSPQTKRYVWLLFQLLLAIGSRASDWRAETINYGELKVLQTLIPIFLNSLFLCKVPRPVKSIITDHYRMPIVKLILVVRWNTITLTRQKKRQENLILRLLWTRNDHNQKWRLSNPSERGFYSHTLSDRIWC